MNLSVQLFTVKEAAALLGEPASQITDWIPDVVDPAVDARPGTGYGLDDFNLLQLWQARELKNARLSGRHIRAIAAVQRVALAGLSADARFVKQYEFSIDTVTTLAAIFGKGPGFDAWYARQCEQLTLMKQYLGEHTAAPASDARARRAHRLHLRRLFISGIKAHRPASAAPLAL